MDQNEAFKLLGQFPHCDAAILHAPSKCEYCDHHPIWQALRIATRVNFTGEEDPTKAPCPSAHQRSARIAHMWPGNRPTNVDVPMGPRTAFEHILSEDLDEDELPETD